MVARLYGRGPTTHGSSAIWPPSTTHTAAQLYGLGGNRGLRRQTNGNAIASRSTVRLPRSLARTLRNLANIRGEAVQHSPLAFGQCQRPASDPDLSGRFARLRLPRTRTTRLEESGRIERLTVLSRLRPCVERSDLFVGQRPANVLDRTRECRTQERTSTLTLLFAIRLTERRCCPIVRRENLASFAHCVTSLRAIETSGRALVLRSRRSRVRAGRLSGRRCERHRTSVSNVRAERKRNRTFAHGTTHDCERTNVSLDVCTNANALHHLQHIKARDAAPPPYPPHGDLDNEHIQGAQTVDFSDFWPSYGIHIVTT